MATGSNVTALYITESGRKIAEGLTRLYPDLVALKYDNAKFAAVWESSGAVIFIMATGIAVRTIAPFLKDKATDPAVISMDDAGNNVVSLTGGHEGGANQIAQEIAAHINANPVISTATDNAGLTSVDTFAKDNNLTIEQRKMLPSVSSKHIKDGLLHVYSDIEMTLPNDYERVTSADKANVIISNKTYKDSNALMLRPRNLTLGLGLNTGTTVEEISERLSAFMTEAGYSILSIKKIATHTKKLEERGLRQYARESGLPLIGLTTDELNSVEGIEQSDAAMRALAVQAVAEPAAILASGGKIEIKKIRTGNLTFALAASKHPAGKLLIVGTGPGGMDYMAPRALEAIRDADAVVGYKTYLAQIEPLVKDKETIATGMTQEVARAKAAVEEALKGRNIAVISGGDPGVYAMAGLVFEVIQSMDAREIDVEVIPGISALNACASRLGAPLMHDFAAISLSDRLTPWELIEKRLEAAASADMVIALYNPKSKERATHIDRAREIVLKHREPTTPVGIVRGATRPNEDAVVTTLGRMLEFDIDMQSTVIIGNSNSFPWQGWFITPRGYSDKYEV